MSPSTVRSISPAEHYWYGAVDQDLVIRGRVIRGEDLQLIRQLIERE